MKVALVNSRSDPAGCNIRNHIEQYLSENDLPQSCRRTYEFFEVEGRLIHAENADAGMDADLVIFLSRHSSVNPVPALTVHATGNFGDAELGGSPRMLAPAAPAMMHATLRELARFCPDNYRVSYEVTHHGPTGMKLPSFFVEIGSTQREWTDPVAGNAVAKAVLNATLQDPIPLIGIGGTHYAPRETAIALSSRGAFGHIASSPKQIALLDRGMVEMMTEKSGAVAAYIDRKAVAHLELERLVAILDSLGIIRLSESEIASFGTLSWDTYLKIRKLAIQVRPGARCIVHGLEGDGSLMVISVNVALFSEAKKSDEHALLQGIGKLPLAHLTDEKNVILPHFVVFCRDSSRLINDLNTLCVKIIRNRERTATEKDFLIIKKVRFDPGKARELGVPAGPAYRELAEGRAVELNGQKITPDRVSVTTETRIHIPGLENYS